jgi:hypothetical protein
MFTLKGNVVIPEPPLLLIEPFKSIWEVDDKDKALKELAYIYFMVCPKRENVFSGYAEDVKREKVDKHLFGKKYNPPKRVKEAMEFYEGYLSEGSVAIRLYKANVKNIESMINYLNDIDYNERTQGGALVHNIDRNKKVSQDSAELLQGLKKLEEQIYKDDYQVEKVGSGRSISEFEL